MKLTSLEKREYDRYFSYYDFSKELKNKTVLVTGAKGLLGQAIIKWILYYNEKYDCRTRIIASTRNEKVIPDYINHDDNIKYCSFGCEGYACSNESIDYIIHCATPTDKSAFNHTPYETLQVIIDGTKSVIDILKSNNKAKLLYVSSEEVYGAVDSVDLISEEYVGNINSLTARSCYPLGKKIAELMCYLAYKEYNLDVRIIRPTVIIGLFQKYDWDRIENEILRCIIENKDLYMKTKGLTKKSVVYSLDVVTAVFCILFYGCSGEAYNVTNPSSYLTVNDNANKMFNLFNKNCHVIYDNDSINKNMFLPKRELLMDINKIKGIGWEPKTTIEEIYQIDIKRFLSSK